MSEEVVKKVELPYGSEYAKSNRSSCKGCKNPISQSSLRMSFRIQARNWDGVQDTWYHYACFWKRPFKNGINEASIKGMEGLQWNDQEKIRDQLKALNGEALNTSGSTENNENSTPKTVPKIEHAKAGTGKCFKCKEKIAKGELRIGYKTSNYHPQCFKDLGVHNGGAEKVGGFENLDDDEKKKIEEILGKATEKRPATDSNDDGPANKQKKVEIDEDPPEIKQKLKEQTETLWMVRDQFSMYLSPQEQEDLLESNGRHKRGGPNELLDQLVDCAVFGVPAKCVTCKKGVLFFNSSGKTYQCTGSISAYTTCTFSTRNPERKPLKITKKIKESSEFLATYTIPTLKERIYTAAMLKEAPVINLNDGPSTSKPKKSEKNSNKMQKMLVKNGCTVDPAAENGNDMHVYIDKEEKYPWQATLGSANLMDNKNQFYKLQLLEHDIREVYYLFRAWGRVGTSIGGSKTEGYPSLWAAQNDFKKLFLEKTLNNWEDRKNFKKHPEGFAILEMDYNAKDDGKVQDLDVNSSKSKLDMPIKELLSMIFDIKRMTRAMQEMEIDTTRMPLGKLSKAHIQNAYRVLTELQNLLNKQEKPKFEQILDASNRFYTLIPYSSGTNQPPILDKLELVKEKTAMLDDLLEMEIAMNLIKSEDGNEEQDVFDTHYEKLKCDMEVLDRKSNEFERIKTYLDNTHADTHRNFKLEIVDVFRVNREVENERFQKDIPNHQLLWHGSRTSNFVGILSQGLRIAPPEAPVSGYMFGKGIYFADMVSKSANYCCAYGTDGLLLLCEVALGKIKEKNNAEYVEKADNGYDSVKGCGGTFPDPKSIVRDENGMAIPLGKPTSDPKKQHRSLLYNEYIVYDVAQVKMRYLIRANFKSSY